MSMFTQSSNSTQQSVDSQASQSSQAEPKIYAIGGVQVDFPTKAYPSQLAMMSKVIQGLKQRKNCLLESPTGSGKSLALLCAALAWQRHEAVRVEKHNAEIEARKEQMSKEKQAKFERELLEARALRELKDQETASAKLLESKVLSEVVVKKEVLDSSSMNISSNDSLMTSDESMDQSELVPKTDLMTDDDDDDFQPRKMLSWTKRSPTFQESRDTQKSQSVKVEKIDSQPAPVKLENPDDNYVSLPAEKLESVPKIYFGTRTHKQISQITQELRRTGYRNVRSVVLASREHTCVNPVVEGRSNKNEACKELLDSAPFGGGCAWQAQAKKYGNFYMLREMNISTSYDLEDLVDAGRQFRVCPYFLSRHLMDQADIIFCPYNYLIDPAIRKSMSIDLDNQIVIFDEAHNMEDASREASSFVVCQDEIQAAMQDFENVGNKGSFEPYAHERLAMFLSTLSGWMSSHLNSLQNFGMDSSGKHWTGTGVIAELDVAGLRNDVVKTNLDYFKVILKHRDEEFEQQKERTRKEKPHKNEVLLTTTVKLMEDVFQLFESLNCNNGKQRDDFRIALLKNTIKRRRGNTGFGMASKEVLSLNIWCLNPAVAFSAIQKAVHSIVLTSGTLSPTLSFQSELDCPFPIKLEASHVIDPSQVFATMVSVGPNNVKLNGSYRSVETFEYQDELGEVIEDVCQKMPYGVLCFFPSYRMLEKVSERWRSTGLWDKLNRIKGVLIEPRTGAQDFQTAIDMFYEENKNPVYPRTGAMFLAVCRGKVSEGLNFSDNNARAVICIGIPFPAFKDLQVELKRNYNQENRSRGLLSGGDWYEIQAFRALNQALGRCIRHRNDWGAILLVDERFVLTPRYISSLPKWIRNSVQSCSSWKLYTRNIIQFRDAMLARPISEPSFVESNIPSSSYLEEDSREGHASYAAGEDLGESFISPNSQSGQKVTMSETYSAIRFANSFPEPAVASDKRKGSVKQKNTVPSPNSTIPQLFQNQRNKNKRAKTQTNW